MHPSSQGLIDQNATPGAHLGCVARVDQCELPTGTLSLVGSELDQLGPRRIQDASVQARLLGHVRPGILDRATGRPGHVLDGKVLEADHTEVFHQAVRQLVGEVLATVGRFLVRQRHGMTVKPALGRAFLVLGKSAAHLREPLLGLLEEARVLDGLARRKGGKFQEAHVDAHGLRVGGQRLGFDLAGEAGEPFAGTGALDGQGLNLALDGPMQNDLNPTNLGQVKLAIGCQLETRTGKGERIVATPTTEAWESWRFASLGAPKKRFESQIHTNASILEYLRMGLLEKVILSLPNRQEVDRVKKGQAGFVGLICHLARFEHLVIHPPTSTQGPLHRGFLGFRRVDSVLKGFLMHIYIVPRLAQNTAAHAAALISPGVNAGVLRAMW